MFKYTLDNKRYHTLNYHNKVKYHSKVFKIGLDAGFSCPNIDGTVSSGGCVFCKSGRKQQHLLSTDELLVQAAQVRVPLDKKWPDSKYIVYFQDNTNTYADVASLDRLYSWAIGLDNVIGLGIATRPDCLSEPVLDLLARYHAQTDLTLELGLQSIHAQTTDYTNRGHSLQCFETALAALRARGIDTVVHIINGLPGETKEMMLETAQYLAAADIQGIKIHMLNVLRGTRLAAIYADDPFPILSRAEYVDIICDQLALFPPELVIHRITGDPLPDDLIAPEWVRKKFCVLNEIDKELVRRDSWQGARCQIPASER